MVLGDPAHDEPFDSLLPIELWRAPHWRSEETTTPDLPELTELTPGICDLDWALAALDGPRRMWRGPVLHAALYAMHGGPRVVIVEPDSERAAAWIAWVSYALPSDLAPRLSFNTFTGQPRYAQDINLCVTTPGCDLGFAEYEHGRDVIVLQPESSIAPETESLYARIVAALAEAGPEAVSHRPDVVNGTPERRGAELAILAGQVALARAEEAGSLLEVLTDLVKTGRWDLAVSAAEAIPASAGNEDALRGWWQAYVVARDSTPEEARSIADRSLRHLLPEIASIPSDLPDLASDSPTTPSPGSLASWLETVEHAASGAERAVLVAGGLRLGLIGCNVALDRRVAQAICETIGDPQMAATFARLADDHKYTAIVDEVVSRLANAAFSDEAALPLLRSALAHSALRDTIDRFATRATTFDERAVWEQLRIEADPAALRDALVALLPLAEDEHRVRDVKRLFGSGGPNSFEEHLLLLTAYRDTGATAADDDVDGALTALAEQSLTNVSHGQRLFDALHHAAPVQRLKHDAVFLAWTAAIFEPPRTGFAQWSGWVAEAAGAQERGLSEELYTELWELAGLMCARCLDLRGVTGATTQRRGRDAERAPREAASPKEEYVTGVTELARAFGQYWPESAARGVERELAKGKDATGLIVNAFLIWRSLPGGTGDLLETALPAAIGRLTARRLQAVERLLAASERDAWLDWLELHPPRPGVSGTVSRLLRRDTRGQ